jgi:hypothetical protein
MGRLRLLLFGLVLASTFSGFVAAYELPAFLQQRVDDGDGRSLSSCSCSDVTCNNYKYDGNGNSYQNKNEASSECIAECCSYSCTCSNVSSNRCINYCAKNKQSNSCLNHCCDCSSSSYDDDIDESASDDNEEEEEEEKTENKWSSGSSGSSSGSSWSSGGSSWSSGGSSGGSSSVSKPKPKPKPKPAAPKPISKPKPKPKPHPVSDSSGSSNWHHAGLGGDSWSGDDDKWSGDDDKWGGSDDKWSGDDDKWGGSDDESSSSESQSSSYSDSDSSSEDTSSSPTPSPTSTPKTCKCSVFSNESCASCVIGEGDCPNEDISCIDRCCLVKQCECVNYDFDVCSQCVSGNKCPDTDCADACCASEYDYDGEGDSFVSNEDTAMIYKTTTSSLNTSASASSSFGDSRGFIAVCIAAMTVAAVLMAVSRLTTEDDDDETFENTVSKKKKRIPLAEEDHEGDQRLSNESFDVFGNLELEDPPAYYNEEAQQPYPSSTKPLSPIDKSPRSHVELMDYERQTERKTNDEDAFDKLMDKIEEQDEAPAADTTIIETEEQQVYITEQTSSIVEDLNAEQQENCIYKSHSVEEEIDYELSQDEEEEEQVRPLEYYPFKEPQDTIQDEDFSEKDEAYEQERFRKHNDYADV